MSKYSHNNVAAWGTGESTNTDSSAGYESLASQTPATYVQIKNSSGVSIDVRKAGSSDDPIVLEAGDWNTFLLVNDVAELEWKRSDDSSSNATISYIWGL